MVQWYNISFFFHLYLDFDHNNLFYNIFRYQDYSDDVLDTSIEEHPVLPMTAKDELIMKNPDALLNGDAVIQVIESCVPTIKNAMALYYYW